MPSPGAWTGSPQKIPLRSVQQQLGARRHTQTHWARLAIGNWRKWDNTSVSNTHSRSDSEEFFHVKKSQASSSEVYEYVHSKRDDASRQSVITYLASRKDLFVKSADGGYVLVAWGNQSVATDNDATLSRILLATKDAYSDRSEMPLSELIRELSERTQFSDSFLYRKVRELSVVEVIENTDGSRAKIIRYTGTSKLPESVKKTPRKPSIRSGIN